VTLVEGDLGSGRVYLRCCYDQTAEDATVAASGANTLPEGLRTLSATLTGAAGVPPAPASSGRIIVHTPSIARDRTAEDARPGHGTAASE
jgi:hypothetical protein